MKPISVAQTKVDLDNQIKRRQERWCSHCKSGDFLPAPKYEGYFCDINTTFTICSTSYLFDEKCTKEDEQNCPILKARVPPRQSDPLLWDGEK